MFEKCCHPFFFLNEYESHLPYYLIVSFKCIHDRCSGSKAHISQPSAFCFESKQLRCKWVRREGGVALDWEYWLIHISAFLWLSSGLRAHSAQGGNALIGWSTALGDVWWIGKRCLEFIESNHPGRCPSGG